MHRVVHASDADNLCSFSNYSSIATYFCVYEFCYYCGFLLSPIIVPVIRLIVRTVILIMLLMFMFIVVLLLLLLLLVLLFLFPKQCGNYGVLALEVKGI